MSETMDVRSTEYLVAMTGAFAECALFAQIVTFSGDDAEFLEVESSTPHELGFGVDDVDPTTMLSWLGECADFIEGCEADLIEADRVAQELGICFEQADGYTMAPRYTAGQAGHDFMLTRCGHGAGFWDRGLGAVGDRLSEMSRPYGDVDLWVQDGKVFGE